MKGIKDLVTISLDDLDTVIEALDITITRLGEDVDNLSPWDEEDMDWREEMLPVIERYEALYRSLTTKREKLT